VIIGAALAFAWLLVLLGLLAWRTADAILRALGHDAASRRSAATRKAVTTALGRVAPMPQSRRTTTAEVSLPPGPAAG
jgi:hypothetical protein